MNSKDFEILNNKLSVSLSSEQIAAFDKYARIFLEKNSRLNLISKNDEKFLFEKHIFDSLAINLFLKPKEGQTLLDIGTGGGFPSVPAAILYDKLNVYALDSIRKKIAAIEEIKSDLKLENLHPICDRAENVKDKFDFITSRAVAPIDTILKYAAPLLKEGAYFVAYKSKRAMDELNVAQKTIKRLGFKVDKIIEYNLPLEEVFERNLIVFKKVK